MDFHNDVVQANDMKPYPEYKDSGVPWLDCIPSHWNQLRIKYLFREKNKRSGDGSGLLLSLTRAHGLIPQAEASNRMASAEDLSKYKVCEIGDLVMNRMQAWSGMFSVARQEGLVSPDYSVFSLCKPTNVDYYERLFKTPQHVEQFAMRSKGIGSGFNRLYTPDFGSIVVVEPPRNEQAAIVRYLDYVDRRIRRYIHAKQRLIAVLNEQKQAIIHQAVTRGLDPNVPLKHSGVEWLGYIPAHWIERRAKYAFREVDERSIAGEEELLSVSHITGVTPRSQKNITMFMAETYVGQKLCHPDDLVINTMWAWMGAMGVARQTGIVSSSYAVYRPIHSDLYEPEYVDVLLRIKPYVSEYVCRSTGIRSSRLRLYPEDFLDIPIVRPPIEEQRRIVAHIRQASSRLVRAVEQTEQEINLIREYRTRLIADVVTGKLDVREAAARLPHEDQESPYEFEDEQEEDENADEFDETNFEPEEILDA